MQGLYKQERSGAIGMLQAGLRVYDVTCYYNCHPLTRQPIRDCYQATRNVKYRCRSG